MLAAAFFVTVIVALAAYHVLIEQPRRAALRARTGPTRLDDVVGPLPGGVFLQNGFTWSRVVPDGGVEIGVHPMLVGLIGGEPEMSLHDPGNRVERGAPFLEIGEGDRALVRKTIKDVEIHVLRLALSLLPFLFFSTIFFQSSLSGLSV